MAISLQCEIGARTLAVETGKIAAQANGSVTVRYGDSLVLVTACVSPRPREGVDFLPLTIDYEERLYAAGKIPGSFFRREGRPSQEAVLTDRLTDRPLRPLFPKGLRNEVQVVVTVLSTDQENSPDILSIIGASAALGISGIPFEGPVSATRIGCIDDELVVNPTFSQLQKSSLDVVVAGTKEGVVMVEAGAKEVAEGLMVEAVMLAQEVNQEIIALQQDLAAAVGKAKMAFEPEEDPAELEARVSSLLDGRLRGAVYSSEDKPQREAALEALQAELVDKLGEDYPSNKVLNAFQSLLKKEVRSRILREGKRPDGRDLKEIRPITSDVGVLPRTHGSGLFTRGLTQVLTIATLGSMREEQTLDTLSPEESKRYLHHYNFPGFSTGEVRRIGSPGRREIGHGALAERALLPVIPDEEGFPYTIRLVSEVLSSNGSTSMASVCGSTLALMDAGVPIKTPVAGIAMGLITGEDGDYAVLTDIQGMEDALGDMDFKVAGSARGITALQMDIKVKGIGYDIMAGALEQAREARLYVLERMRETISEARTDLSPYAPRMLRISIPPDKIGAVIGPGGRTIRSIIDETKATIDVNNDGTVVIGSTNQEAARRAVEIIENLTKEVEVGAIYTGKVTRTASFGAFVEILPGKEGLVRIGDLADYRVPSVEDVVSLGDEITVMVMEIDSMGRINLSRRAVFQGTPGEGEEGPGRPRDTFGGRPPPRPGVERGVRSPGGEGRGGARPQGPGPRRGGPYGGGNGRGGQRPQGPRPGPREERGPGFRGLPRRLP